MKERLMIRLVALLLLLALLTLLVVKHEYLTAGEVEDGTVRSVVKLRDLAARHVYGAVAFLALMVLFAYVTWTALRARQGKDRETPAGESSASDTTAKQ